MVKKASVIAASGVLFLLAVWEADERLNHSKGRGWLLKRFIDDKTVDLDEVKDWLERSPLVDDTENAEEIIDAVIEEGLMKKLLRRLPHNGDR